MWAGSSIVALATGAKISIATVSRKAEINLSLPWNNFVFAGLPIRAPNPQVIAPENFTPDNISGANSVQGRPAWLSRHFRRNRQQTARTHFIAYRLAPVKQFNRGFAT